MSQPRQWTRYRSGHVGRTRVPPESAWEDIGAGVCPLCQVERRLYRPLMAPEVTACAKCSQAYALSSISNISRALANDV